MGLVHDDARHVAAFADTKHHRLCRHRPFRHPAHAFDPHQPVRLDPAHEKAQLVHMGEQHDRGGFGIAFEGGDHIAHPVHPADDPLGGQARADQGGHTLFMARQAGCQHQVDQIGTQARLHFCPRSARTRAMKSSARSGSTAFQV